MDFHSMKRKELQALCKKHNLLANGTNVDMAERLASHLKKPVAEEPKSKKVRFSLDVIDLTNSEDRRNMRKIEDLRVKKSSMKPGFEKCDQIATSVPARSTRSRTQVKETEEEVIVVSSSSPVEKRSTRRLVNRESGNLDVSGFSTIQTRSMKRARPLVVENSTIAEDTTRQATTGSKRNSIALINLLAEESPMLSKNDTYANEFYVQGTTMQKGSVASEGYEEEQTLCVPKTTMRQSRARKRVNEDGDAAAAVESVSASRTHYATRSAKRKSIASTNLVAENSFRPSKLDFRVNEDGDAPLAVHSVSASRTRYATRSAKRKSIASTNLVAEKSLRPSKLDFRVNEDGDALSAVRNVSVSKTRYSTRSAKRKSVASTNLVAEKSLRPSKLDFRENEDGDTPSRSVSASRTRYETRSAKRKSIASNNLVAEKSLRPSKLDFRANEATEHQKGTVASGNSDGHITRAKILSFVARRIVVEIALQANEESPVGSVGGPNLELNPSFVEESAHALENARDEPKMFGLTDNGNVTTFFEERCNREKREQVNQQISLADNVHVEEASQIIEEFLVGIGAGSSPQSNLNIINGPVKPLGNAKDVHEDASLCDGMGTLVEKTCFSEKERVDEPEEFMESTPINAPLRTQASVCYSSKDTKGRSSMFDFEDVGESTTVKRQQLMVENLVEIRQESSECNLEQLKNADVLVEGNTTSEDTCSTSEDTCFKNEDKMPIIYHCSQDDASRNVKHKKHLDNNTESVEEGQYVEIMPFTFSRSKDDASRNVEDEKHQDNTENVEGQYVEIMPKITNNCIYIKGDMVSETEESVDDTSDELIKSNEDFKEILYCKAGNKVLANDNMSMLSCHLQADASENIEDKKYLDFVFVNEEGLLEGSVEITDQVKKNNIDVKKDLVLEADDIVIAISGEAFAKSPDCMAGKNVAKDEDKMPMTSLSSLAPVDSSTMENKKELEPFIVNGGDVLEAQHLDIILGDMKDPVDVKKDLGLELDDIVDVVYDDQVEVDEVSHETFECKSDKDLPKGEDKMPISMFKAGNYVDKDENEMSITSCTNTDTSSNIEDEKYLDRALGTTKDCHIPVMNTTEPCEIQKEHACVNLNQPVGENFTEVMSENVIGSFGFDDPLVNEAVKDDVQLTHETVGCELSALVIDPSVGLLAGNEDATLIQNMTVAVISGILNTGVSTMPLNAMKEDVTSSQNWTHGERFKEQEMSKTVQDEKPEDTKTAIGKEQFMADSVLREILASSEVSLLGRLSVDEDDEKENLSVVRQTNDIGHEVCDTETELKENAEITSNNPVSASVEKGQYIKCLPVIASDEHFGAIRGVALEKHSLVSDLPIKHGYQENIRVEELISAEKITDQEEGQIAEGSVSASQENLDELGYKENHMVQKVETVNDCPISILDHSTSEPCEVEKENANVTENQLGLDNVAVDSPGTAKTTSLYCSDLPVENIVKSQGELNVSEINLFSGDNAGNDDIALAQKRTCREILEAAGMGGTARADRVEDTNNKLEPQDQNRNAGVSIMPFNQIKSNDVPQKNIEPFVSMAFVGEEAELKGTLSESTPKNKAGKNIMDEINTMLTKMYISSAVNRKGFGPHKIQKTPVRLSKQLQQSGLLKSQTKENRANAKVEQTPNCQVAKSGMKRQALEELQGSKYRRGLLSFR